jgi:hypothetical protein
MAADMWSVIIKKGTKCFVSIKTMCKVTAYSVFEKEAESLKEKEYIELWHVGKLVSRCQYEEIENENG